MKRSIYPVKSQTLPAVFCSGAKWGEVLLVPLDFGKREHAAQFCLGNGTYLLGKHLRIFNTSEGAEYFLERLRRVLNKHKIPDELVLIVSEDPPPYLINFIERIRKEGYQWARVNAREAAKLRSTARASSDGIDLSGIAQAAISRRARELEAFDGLYHCLKSAARARRKFVMDETAAKNRVHNCVDVLFPGFLNEANSGLRPFSEGSLDLMEREFSPARITRMRIDTLVGRLRKSKVPKPEAVAAELKLFAESALPAPADIVASRQKMLAVMVSHLRSVRVCLAAEENEMAGHLVQSPGFHWTSIPGIGVVLSGQMMSELGDPHFWLPVDNTASYAGIVCRQSQTGGAGKPPIKGALPMDCNHVLKDYLLQAAQHVGTTLMSFAAGLPVDQEHTLYKHYLRLRDAEARSRLGTARKLLKVMRRLALSERCYMPFEWLDFNQSPEQGWDGYEEFFERQLENLKQKWKPYDLSGIDPEKNRLLREEKLIGQMRRMSLDK